MDLKMIDYDKEIGAKLRELRKKEGFTLVEVADMIGVGYQAVSQIEISGRVPSIKTTSKILDVLGYDLNIDIVKKDPKK